MYHIDSSIEFSLGGRGEREGESIWWGEGVEGGRGGGREKRRGGRGRGRGEGGEFGGMGVWGMDFFIFF